MKKRLLGLLTVLSAASLPVLAQSEAQALRVSAVLGLSANQIDGDGLGGYNKPGLIIGGAAKFSVSEKFSVQPEVMYVQKGSRTSSRDSLANLSGPQEPYQKWRINVIEIPVLLGYQFLPRFSFQLGPGFGYLISAKADRGFAFEDRSDQFKKLDITGIGALEYVLTEGLNLNLRFDYSLQPYTKGSPSFLVEPSRPGFYNNSILISLRAQL